MRTGFKRIPGRNDVSAENLKHWAVCLFELCGTSYVPFLPCHISETRLFCCCIASSTPAPHQSGSVQVQGSPSHAVASSDGGEISPFQYQAEYLRNTVKELVDEMG